VYRGDFVEVLDEHASERLACTTQCAENDVWLTQTSFAPKDRHQKIGCQMVRRIEGNKRS
jgi:hypothetical protein